MRALLIQKGTKPQTKHREDMASLRALLIQKGTKHSMGRYSSEGGLRALLIQKGTKGIFVFESKNYSGWIFGDEKEKYWTAMLPNKQKNKFYNPIMQNKTHLKWIRSVVGDEIPLFSIIVFSERCELKKVTVYSEDVKVIKRDLTYATVRSIWDKNPDMVSEDRINELYECLRKLTNVDEAVKAAHIENIEKKYKQQPAESQQMSVDNNIEATTEVINEAINAENAECGEMPEETLLCPKCGAPLVLRTAKKGSNAGNQFYGCSAFPKCRYTQEA